MCDMRCIGRVDAGARCCVYMDEWMTQSTRRSMHRGLQSGFSMLFTCLIESDLHADTGLLRDCASYLAST